MLLQNELCSVEISIDRTYTVGSADNKPYDTVYNPGNFRRDWNTTFSIEIDGINGKTKIALVGDFFSYDYECAILEGEVLTVLQNHSVSQIDIADGELLRHKEFECFGTNNAIYRVENGYVIYGEVQITMLDLQLNKLWDFSGRDIFVSVTGKNCFELTEDSIRLYDFEDNYYEIDFNGKLINEKMCN